MGVGTSGIWPPVKGTAGAAGAATCLEHTEFVRGQDEVTRRSGLAQRSEPGVSAESAGLIVI